MARATLSEADVTAVLDTLKSGWLTMGPRIQALEAGFAEQLGVAHAVAVGSGTSALHLACLAAGVEDGAGAVVGALAAPAAVNAPRQAGGRALRADVSDPAAPAVTSEAILAAAGVGTRAVILSHLGGFTAEAVALRARCEERGWLLIEDVTDALGARLADGRPAGVAGHLGCFSFASHRVVGVGEGGMVTTDDDALAARVRSLRSHAMTTVTWDRHRGHAESYDIVDLGFNARMDEPRAALASSRLARLEELVAERAELVQAVRAAVAGRDGVLAGWGDADLASAGPQVASLVLAGERERERERDAVLGRLGAAGVPAATWPDAWAGVPEAAAAPTAQAARARTVLLDLGALGGAGIAAAALGETLAGVLDARA